MPYQGDRHHDRPQTRFTTDFSYLRKLPGAIILIQLACSTLGFSLAAAGTAVWRVTKGHSFFTFVAFLSMMSCVCWLVVRVFQLDAMFKRKINWNLLGLVHNGVNAFFLMIGSCFMVEAASSARTLRAAGVFGFLGFSAFLSGLVWEAIIWYSNRSSGPGFMTASVMRGRERSRTPESEQSTGVAEAAEQDGGAGVNFVGMKARPVSSFMEQSGHTAEMSTPMLVVPRAVEEDSHSSQRSSTGSSVQGEWQMPSSVPA